MKTSSLVKVAAVIGGIYVLSRVLKPQSLGDSDILDPSPDDGKWITKGSLYGMDGWGKMKKKFSKTVRKATKQVVKVAKKVVPAAAGGVMLAPVFIAKAVRGGKKSKSVNAPAGSKVEYRDENGNVITEAQYNAIVDGQAAAAPTGTAPSTADAMATDPFAQNLTANQSSGGGGGGSSFDAGTPETAASEGSPAMPLQVTSAETPSADIDPQTEIAPEEAPAKVGVLPWLVGGGILAAVVAAKS